MTTTRYHSILRAIPVLLTVFVLCLDVCSDVIYAEDELPGIGAMGDSITAEYSRSASYYGDSSALNWIDLLARLRGLGSSTEELTFGKYQTNADIWGSPRYGGYENNWALGGANSATLLSQGQHHGIAKQVREGHVQYAALFIGTNDFYPYHHDAYGAIYSQTMPFLGAGQVQYANVDEYVDSIVARYTTALDTVSDAGARLIMATIADFGVTPLVIGEFSDAQKRQRVTNVVKTVNDRLKALAVARALPIVDIFELANLYLGSDPLMVGGVPITRGAPASANGQYLVLPDRVHPGTVWQGLLANAFIEACNRTYATNFTPLSDQEILSAAGINYASGDETFFDITPFVIVPTLAKYSGGTGEPNDPYQIATADDLMLLGESTEDYDKHFILTADIDLSGHDFTNALIAPDVGDIDWLWEGVSFTGTFDGKGHKIIGLTIDDGGANSHCIGLFGRNEGEVRNLGIERCSVNGDKLASGLVAWNCAIVSNCYSTGDVSGERQVGGLVGRNANGDIVCCYSTCGVGGDTMVGGLVGVNLGRVSNCYSTGSVSGREAVGGLAGDNFAGIASNCYSTGSVSGDDDVGGLVGNNSDEDESGKALYCFWDTQASGMNHSIVGSGKTTVEMQDVNTYLNAGWDLINVWGIGENQTYPYLRKYSAVDINQDESVNFGDLAILADNWLASIAP